MVGTVLDFLQTEPSLQAEVLRSKEKVVPTCLHYLHLIGLYSLKVEQQRGEAVEDM